MISDLMASAILISLVVAISGAARSQLHHNYRSSDRPSWNTESAQMQASDNNLFTLSSAVRHDPAVDAWLGARRDAPGLLAREWFNALRKCGADIHELVHDGSPVACVGDAAFAYVNAFTAHTNVGFFYGAFLADPNGLLSGTGKRMRHVKLRPGEEIDAAGLGDLIDAAYRDITRRLATYNQRTQLP